MGCQAKILEAQNSRGSKSHDLMPFCATKIVRFMPAGLYTLLCTQTESRYMW